MKTLWEKVTFSLLKMSRGLIAEKKEGTWEMSSGRVAFWLVLTHCLWVWHKLDPAAPGNHMDVSEGELNTLWALLGYSGLKVVGDTVSSLKSKAAPKTVVENVEQAEING